MIPETTNSMAVWAYWS